MTESEWKETSLYKYMTATANSLVIIQAQNAVIKDLLISHSANGDQKRYDELIQKTDDLYQKFLEDYSNVYNRFSGKEDL